MNLDWSVVWDNVGALARGTELTVLLAVVTMVLAVPGGILLALMRLSRSRLLSGASASFTELFRNLPLLLVIYAAYYVLPLALGVAFSPFVTALVALGLNVSAYNGETFRVLEMLTAMAVIYWSLGYPQAKLVDWLNRRFGVSE